MATGHAAANGIELAYETHGDPSDPTLVMVMGLGLQLIHWHGGLIEQLDAEGFHVVVFDNRDTGLSSKIEAGPKPNLWAGLLGRGGSASYTLDDMADDTVGLLDHLEIERAHMLGASLGGMIAQTVALRHRERVLSLASLMSTTGSRRVGFPRLKALRILLGGVPATREDYLEYSARTFRVIGSPAFPMEDAWVRELAAAGYDRCYHPAGIARQLLAVVASGDRTHQLRRLDVPTVVIHGREDPMVPLGAGRATARAIPGAELVEIPGMGHDLPPDVWGPVIEAVARNAARATTAPRAAPVAA